MSCRFWSRATHRTPPAVRVSRGRHRRLAGAAAASRVVVAGLVLAGGRDAVGAAVVRRPPADPATATVAVYLLVQFALFVALRYGVPRVAFLAGTADTALVRAAVRAAFWAIAAGLLLTAHEDHFAVTSVAAATVAIIAILGLAYRDGHWTIRSRRQARWRSRCWRRGTCRSRRPT